MSGIDRYYRRRTIRHKQPAGYRISANWQDRGAGAVRIPVGRLLDSPPPAIDGLLH